MSDRGRTLYMGITAERMTYLEPAAETGGKRMMIELRAAPGGRVAAHVHPNRWETLRVVSGTLGAKVGGRKTELSPGQVLGVAPRVAHAWWNAGDDELVVRCEISTALGFGSPFEQLVPQAA